jgi:hypothetical protein
VVETYVVRSSNGDAVLMGMPAHMQNLLVEVDLIGVGLLAHTLGATSWGARPTALLAVLTSTGVHGRGNADLLRLEGALVRLQHDLGVLVRVARVDHEVVVIRACHDILRVSGESHLELVEDAVVLVGVTESGSEVLMNGDCLYWLTFHVYVPDFNSKIIAGKDVTTIVAEADIRDGGDDLGEEGARGWVLFLLEFYNNVSLVRSRIFKEQTYASRARRTRPFVAYLPT